MWSDFWSFVWFFFWTFAFVAYLMTLFSIIGDIFRDHELNGWFKALWTLFLIFVPFITALVYLIARGRGMAERSERSHREAEDATRQYIRAAAGSSPADEIAKAKALFDAGTITQPEFDSIKSRVLV
jgi:hypothetical protein